MYRFGLALLLILLSLPALPEATPDSGPGEASERASAEKPRLAILLTRAQVDDFWQSAQVSGQAWGAVANLAGIPYDTLFVEDALLTDSGEALLTYDSLVLAQVNRLPESAYAPFCDLLEKYLSEGGGVIVDGPPAIFDEHGSERTTERIRSLLGTSYVGYHGGRKFRIRVEDDGHFATRTFDTGEFVTQHLDAGINVTRFADGGDILLSARSAEKSYPYLSVREQGDSRIAVVSDLAASAGVTSFFRNHQPKGFYANRIFDPLVALLQWSVYGSPTTPFPVLQLSNAAMTATIRLDADQSYEIEEQVETLNYLIDLAKETGVVALYGWVSDWAADAGWAPLAELGGRLEAAGGQIATHSRFHEMDGMLDDRIAKTELDDSVNQIERAMLENGQMIGKVEFFINPNSTIPMQSYGLIADRFSFYMTHGFEQMSPLGYGNLTWNANGNGSFVVVSNSPAPDYQWFYDSAWDYSTAQVTAYQEAIFDHMFEKVGRGVLYNQMWHDYGITSSVLDPDLFDWWGLWPQEQPPDQRPMYDGLAMKFATRDVYAPDAVDLGQKLRAMAQWDYSWDATDDGIDMTLDLSVAKSPGLGDYAGGMGIRIENHGDRIQSVSIDGKDHPAFSDNVIILPNLSAARHDIEIRLGQDAVRSSHLRYVSKRMPALDATGESIKVSLLTRSKARFAFYAGTPSVLLNADWQEWNRRGDRMLRGYVTSDRTVELREYADADFRIVRATLPIVAFSQDSGTVQIDLIAAIGDERELAFRSARVPERVVWNDSELAFTRTGRDITVKLPEFELAGTLMLQF